MGKLYFKYGVMGSAKTAQALLTRYNYEEKGMRTWLIKPSVDTRDDAPDGTVMIRSRVGLTATADAIAPGDDIGLLYSRKQPISVIIADEAQFFTEQQIEQLRYLASFKDVTVLCYGLRTDFRGHAFPGSRALFELADSLEEIKAMCECGRKAIINARYNEKQNGYVIAGSQIDLGGNDKYKGVCYACWRKGILSQTVKPEMQAAPKEKRRKPMRL